MNEDIHTYIEPELEARITALVLGEASEFEADELEKLLKEKPELAIFRRRMQAMHDLLGEAVKPEPDENWQLSSGRRASLKNTLTKSQPATTQKKSRIVDRHQWRSAVSIAACLLVCVVLFAFMTPLYKSGSLRKSELQVFEPEIISYSAPSEEKGRESFGLEEAKQSMISSGKDRDLEELPMAGRLFRQEGEEIMDSKPRRPSVPSSSRSRVIAANEPSVRAIPVPEDEAPGLSLDFGNGDGFGDGFGDSGGSGHELGYSWSPKKAERDGRVAGRDEDRFEGSTAFSGVAGINIAGVIDAEGALFERGSEIANNGKKVQKPTATPLFSLEVADEGQREDSRFLYFSEYEPPELPNTATGGSVWSGEAKFPVTPATPRAWYFDKSIAEREITRRSALVPSADAALLFGRDAYDEGDYVKAAEEYKKAMNLLPSGSALDDRSRAYSDHLNDANLALAQKRRQLMDVAERTGVIWLGSEKGKGKQMAQLELRDLAEKKFYEANREKEQLQAHSNKLLKSSDDDLIKVAAELPDTGLKESYDHYTKAQRDLAAMKAKGLGSEHPDMVAREKNVTELKAVLKKNTENVIKSLQDKLKTLESRTHKMRQALNVEQDKGTERARNLQKFNELRKEYQSAKEAKEKIEAKYKELQKKSDTQKELKPRQLKPLPDEILTRAQPFSTFSLNVSDVSFKLAKASLLEKGQWPDAAKVRTEEFVNAFNYGDPSPSRDEQVSCAIEQSAHPFLQQRNLLRIGMKTASSGRSAPLRLTVLLDNSGSMEREDREASVLAAIEVLAGQLGAQDVITLVGFASKPRLLADRLSGDQATKLVQIVANTPSEGGTNLEEALRLARSLALRQRSEGAQDRVVLITDGVANLGNTVPAQLAAEIETMRQQGIAFDACGVGAEGLNDDILESLTRKGDGRYYFLNRAEDADAGFVKQLAGALSPAAKNVKVQVKFNPNRVSQYRLLGFEKHRLNKQDFRNDQVDAAEMAAEEAGNAVYQIQVNPNGTGELGEVFVRFLDTKTNRMVERSWPLPYEPQAKSFDQAAPSMQLAGTAAMLGEKLHGTDAGSVRFSTISDVLGQLRGHYSEDPKVQDLIRMCQKVK